MARMALSWMGILAASLLAQQGRAQPGTEGDLAGKTSRRLGSLAVSIDPIREPIAIRNEPGAGTTASGPTEIGVEDTSKEPQTGAFLRALRDGEAFALSCGEGELDLPAFHPVHEHPRLRLARRCMWCELDGGAAPPGLRLQLARTRVLRRSAEEPARLEVEAYGGEPDAGVMLVAVDLDGKEVLHEVARGSFDATGRWTFTAVLPDGPRRLGFLAVARDRLGRVAVSHRLGVLMPRESIFWVID